MSPTVPELTLLLVFPVPVALWRLAGEGMGIELIPSLLNVVLRAGVGVVTSLVSGLCSRP